MPQPLPQSLTCSTREAAQMLGVSIRTAQLWVEDGRLRAWKTPGGHRRILVESVDVLLEEQRRAGLNVSRQRHAVVLLCERTRERTALRNALAAALPDCTIWPEGNGFEALMRIGEVRPEVVITEVGVSGIDFFRMMSVLTAHAVERPMRIVALLASNVDRAALRERLSNDVILVEPPVDGQELAALVWGVLNGDRRATASSAAQGARAG